MNPDSPELSLFRAHLEEAPFTAGVDVGRWSLLKGEDLSQWPYCRIELRCDPRFSAEGRVVLRFNLDGYPASAPTAQPWDADRNVPLPHDRWPQGSGHVNSIFKPTWNPSALYMPCDRAAMPGHEGWRETYPQWWWTPKHTIATYLAFLTRHLLPTGNE
jgi:hypothetical protein